MEWTLLNYQICILPLEYLLSTRALKKAWAYFSENLDLTNQVSDIYTDSKVFGDRRETNTFEYLNIFSLKNAHKAVIENNPTKTFPIFITSTNYCGSN